MKIRELQFFLENKDQEVRTVNDLLFRYVANILCSFYSFYVHEGVMFFNIKSTIFVNEDDEKEPKYLADIFRLLDCGIGEKSFSVIIAFEEGVSSADLCF